MTAVATSPAEALNAVLFPDCYRIGFDWESHLIGPQNVIPSGVCLSYAFDDGGPEPQIGIGTTGDPGSIETILGTLFDPMIVDGMEYPLIKVAHNAAFDLGVTARKYPQIISKIFAALERGQIHCTKIREKLLNLVLHGDIAFTKTASGDAAKVDYSQAALLKKYTGIDKSHLKQGDDIWRLHYSTLDGVPLAQWPAEAKDYAVGDSVDCLIIHAAQEKIRQDCIRERGVDPFAVQDFRVFADFALFLMTAWGVKIDPEEKAKVEKFLAEELDISKMQLLLKHNILRPGTPSRPYANGAKNADGTPKMTEEVAPSINKAALQAHVLKLAETDEEIKEGLKYTEPSKRFPEGQLQVDAAFLEEFADRDPVLSEYKHRQDLQKLVTTEMPRMNWEGQTAEIVHPNYDVLKVTGRTSSFAGELFPSFNCQNVHPKVRGCVIPRPGTVLFSIDYSQMELVTLAQQCLYLFGKSVLADKINAGEDVHGFLGAQIAFATHQGFNEFCVARSMVLPDDRAKVFMEMKKAQEGTDERVFFEHFRKLAKPTGLGYPGGLGPKTFIAYAKGTYGVDVDLDTATTLREVWKDAFPEMPEYFKHINEKLVDPWHPPEVKMKDGKEKRSNRYAYSTPFGMWRSNADYCSTANGFGLQAFAAEGAITGVCNVVRACFDEACRSIIYGGVLRPILFIHDEIVGEVDWDSLTHERIQEVQRIMEQSMQQITPNVRVKTEACLMHRWDKAAKPVFDDNKRLQIWKPRTA